MSREDRQTKKQKTGGGAIQKEREKMKAAAKRAKAA
jgi:hypothetical protein